MLIFLCLLLCFFFSQNRIIKEMQEIHIKMELGTAFSENIPLLFKQFQHSQIKQFKRDTPYHENPICHINFGQNGVLRQRSIIRHHQSNETFINTDRIIYEFQKLDSLRVFIDAIEFQSWIVTLYSNNQIVFYEFDKEIGNLMAKYRIQLNETRTIKQAQFSIINDQLYIFTTNKAYTIQQQTLVQVKGYSRNSFNFNSIKSVNKSLLMSAGDKGIILYQITQHTLNYISNISFEYIIKQQNLFFSVDKFSIDEDTNSIFILDQAQGIIQADLQQLTQGKVVIKRVVSLIGGCQNMIVTAWQIYLTCPELIHMSRSKGQVLMSKYNSFYAFDIGYNGKRVFLFGHQGLAVYDIFGNIISEHYFSHISEKLMIIGNFLITFADQAIQSFNIVSHTEKLYCHTSDESKVGEYKGTFITRGQCDQYFQTKLESSDLCQIVYPFILTISNSSSLDLTTQILLICIWLGISALVACFFFFQHHFAHRNYKQLIEQQSKQNIDIVSKMQMKKSNEQQVN